MFDFTVSNRKKRGKVKGPWVVVVCQVEDGESIYNTKEEVEDQYNRQKGKGQKRRTEERKKKKFCLANFSSAHKKKEEKKSKKKEKKK